ncbi:MAG: GntR family transcriptional regulator [Sneathiellaceae bacterium]
MARQKRVAEAAPASDMVAGGTLASTVYQRLRREIVTTGLKPGAKLRIEALSERYNVGASPVREALNRLSAEGLVDHEDQKGFRIAPVSLADLLELNRTRCWINEVALRESIGRGDQEWEESVLIAYHRLSKVPGRLPDESGEINPEWERLHLAFHRSLIAACGSKWMLRFAEVLSDCADRYRHLSAAARVERDVPAEHEAIMEAVIRRRTQMAISLLNEHMTRTSDNVQKLLQEFDNAGGRKPAAGRSRAAPRRAKAIGAG